jgi:hypothetical protein
VGGVCCVPSLTGETDPAATAALGSPRLHATQEQLCDALGASADVQPLYRRLLAMTLAELDLLESHMQQLDEELAAFPRASGCRAATRGGAGFRCRFGGADHRRDRPHGDGVPDRQTAGVLVGSCLEHDERAGIKLTAVTAPRAATAKRVDCSTNPHMRR